MITRLALLLLSLFVLGCSSSPAPDASPGESQRLKYNQVCEMCGTEWAVSSNDPDEEVPPTVEWCFHDGQYCMEGFEMVLLVLDDRAPDDIERRWLNHCMTCEGCRCASFSPEEWHEILDGVAKVRDISTGTE